jgi:hypothetical protein
LAADSNNGFHLLDLVPLTQPPRLFFSNSASLGSFRQTRSLPEKVYVEALNLSQSQLAWVLTILAALMSVVYAFNRNLKLQFHWPVKLFFVPLCLYAVWLLAPEGSLPYIYFDF